jgi:hypothetical protein
MVKKLKKTKTKYTWLYLENEGLSFKSVNWKRIKSPHKLIPNHKLVGEGKQVQSKP